MKENALTFAGKRHRELHMLFVSAGGGAPPLDVVGIQPNQTMRCSIGLSIGGSEGSDEVVAELYEELRDFKLDGAHCFDPNEVRQRILRVGCRPKSEHHSAKRANPAASDIIISFRRTGGCGQPFPQRRADLRRSKPQFVHLLCTRAASTATAAVRVAQVCCAELAKTRRVCWGLTTHSQRCSSRTRYASLDT